jgi:hypothetical protein
MASKAHPVLVDRGVALRDRRRCRREWACRHDTRIQTFGRGLLGQGERWPSASRLGRDRTLSQKSKIHVCSRCRGGAQGYRCQTPGRIRGGIFASGVARNVRCGRDGRTRVCEQADLHSGWSNSLQ